MINNNSPLEIIIYYYSVTIWVWVGLGGKWEKWEKWWWGEGVKVGGLIATPSPPFPPSSHPHPLFFFFFSIFFLFSSSWGHGWEKKKMGGNARTGLKKIKSIGSNQPWFDFLSLLLYNTRTVLRTNTDYDYEPTPYRPSISYVANYIRGATRPKGVFFLFYVFFFGRLLLLLLLLTSCCCYCCCYCS